VLTLNPLAFYGNWDKSRIQLYQIASQMGALEVRPISNIVQMQVFEAEILKQQQ
jgi:hypothetical protein